MNVLNWEIEQLLRNENADFVHFVDISMLNVRQNRGLPYAILVGLVINPQFIKTVHGDPNYVQHTPFNTLCGHTSLHILHLPHCGDLIWRFTIDNGAFVKTVPRHCAAPYSVVINRLFFLLP